jgi:UPF0755 protein
MLKRERTRTTGKYLRWSLLIVFLGVMVTVLVVFRKYQSVFSSNVDTDGTYEIFYVPTGSSYEEVRAKLEEAGILLHASSFDWVAEKKGYPSAVKPGRYRIEEGMSNNDLVNMLRAGDQDPVMVVFNRTRTFAQLAGKVAPYLEADSLDFLRHFSDPSLPEKYGFTAETFFAMFIPNTYEFFWTATPMEFTDRMYREYEAFWKQRDKQASAIGMSRTEVSTLASIIDEETLHDDENPTVAGVYMNRLKMNMPLQACPTLKYIKNDWTIQRVLTQYKTIESPYNTYKHSGLPPGPITIPSISAIDAVLNYEKHNYLYMAAKSDFSGYHAFARTLQQHNRNAAKYQRELDKEKIFK